MVSPPTVNKDNSSFHRDHRYALSGASGSKAIQPIVPSNQIERCLDPHYLRTEKALPFVHLNSPPPILRSSLHPPSPCSPQSERDAHLLVVDHVSAALLDGDMDKDSTGDTGLSDDDGDAKEMSEDGDPDDDMTLVQYQEEARREALIRKNTHSSCSSLKKGRMESEITGS